MNEVSPIADAESGPGAGCTAPDAGPIRQGKSTHSNRHEARAESVGAG